MNTCVTDFPSRRGRRLRSNPWIRNLVAENHVTLDDLIWPVFVREGTNITEPVPELPGVNRYSIDTLVEQVIKASDLGIRCVAVFPCTPSNLKNETCEEAWNPGNLVNKTTQLIKKKIPEMGVMLDVALDPYNSFGHDGLVRNGQVLNDETLEALMKQALVQAESGADILGPSDMMDGRVKAIRESLEKNSYQNTLILSYSAKFASSFYGPFRSAIGSSGNLVGDKKTYQLDYRNSEEALRDVAADIKEGADMVMVKPGMPYLDLCKQIKERFKIPTFAYQVSGEYAMIASSIEKGFFDKNQVIIESITCFKRAGCDGVLTYFAPELAQILYSN
ncbi:MAG: porphobilinogen synthase [Rhodobacteraceae bacterium]|nr:MAG: porphobilinogen synthase [Paracoccaceae bacterium]